MSGTATAATIIVVVAILAALTAWVAWLGARNNTVQRRQHDVDDNGLLALLLIDRPSADLHLVRLVRQCVDSYYARHQHTHEYASTAHDHDAQYAPTGHTHDERYSYIEHNHNGDYAPLQHSHQEYALRSQTNHRLTWIEQQLTFMRTAFVQSQTGILLGALLGGFVGALIGFVLDLTLPASAFQIHATTTFNVGGKQIVQHLTSYDAWPKWGIPLGCAVAGMILGGLALWLVGLVRDRRQSTPETTEV